MPLTFLRRFMKAQYRVKGLRVFAVGGVREGANLKRYVAIQKSVVEEKAAMPEENPTMALTISASAQSATSALLASAVQTCSDLKDQVDQATVGDESTPLPGAIADGILNVCDQLMNGAKALTGMPESEPVQEPEAQMQSAAPVAAVEPTQEQIAKAAEEMILSALAIAKGACGPETIAKANAIMEKAKAAPRMSYKQFLGMQSTHMVRLFDLMVELLPFMADLSETPAVQAAEQADMAAANVPAIDPECAPESMGPASVAPIQAAIPGSDATAIEDALPKPAVPAEGETVEKALPDAVVAAITEKSMEERIMEKMSTLMEKALAPVVSALTTHRTSTEKSITEMSAGISRLQKSRGASQSIVVDPSSAPGGSNYSGSRDLAKEVRAEREAARKQSR